jgi:3-oxosteroid 1-dehydrogenase
MRSISEKQRADIVIIGFGAAGACAAIAAHDAGARVILLEKQAEAAHYSNTRMSGGGFHSPSTDGDFESIKSYAKAMFCGANLPHKLEGEQPEFSDELATMWAKYSPQNEAFMCGLDSQFKTFRSAGTAFPDFPGAAGAGYAVLRSTFSGSEYESGVSGTTMDAPKIMKEAGEAFHACLLSGLLSRSIPIHYGTVVKTLSVDDDGAVSGVMAERDGKPVHYQACRAVIITCGGYEYNPRMRKAFLDGPGKEGWAFYGSPANTGDGIRMALKIGAALSKAGSVAARVICAIPERRHGLKIGLNTSAIGKPNQIVVDNAGRRYAAERRITKDPSRYIFYKEVMHFDTVTLNYPRIPSWMVCDSALIEKGPIVSPASTAYHGIEWDRGNLNAINNGWILQGNTLEELAEKIRQHPDNRNAMDTAALVQQVDTWNNYCASRRDPDFDSEPGSMGPVRKPPFYAIPLYPGGPNTKGGLRSNAQRQVLDWDDQPIPRLYTAGEISSVFQFVYQGGGNLAECIVFGRIAGANAAAEEQRPNA